MHRLVRRMIWTSISVEVGTRVREWMTARRVVFVSLDYEHDRDYRYLIDGWDRGRQFTLSFRNPPFVDALPDDAHEIARMKETITHNIYRSRFTLVIVGKHANKQHPDHAAIGQRNWLEFELAITKQAKQKILAVKLDPSNEPPEQLKGADVTWVPSFTQRDVIKAMKKHVGWR